MEIDRGNNERKFAIRILLISLFTSLSNAVLIFVFYLGMRELFFTCMILYLIGIIYGIIQGRKIKIFSTKFKWLGILSIFMYLSPIFTIGIMLFGAFFLDWWWF